MSNRIKVRIKPVTGRVELTLERRDARDSLLERSRFTVDRRVFERALAEASIEVPWKELGR